MGDFVYKKHYQYFLNGCLNLTDNCNLACKYCFVQQKPHYMTLDTGKQAIDFFMSNYLNKKRLLGEEQVPDKMHLTFFGGEPMLMFEELIKPLTEYIEKNYPNHFMLSITTNGTLLNEEKIKYLYNHNIYPLLSIDGPKIVQDFNRPRKDGGSSFDLLEPNIPLILKYFPNTTFRSTIDRESSQHLFETYCFAMTRGFNNIFFIPNSREEWSEVERNNLASSIHKIFTYLMYAFANNEPIITCNPINDTFGHIFKRDLSILNNDKIDNICDYQRSPIHCGLGTGSASIGYDGKIYGCQEQDSRDTNNFFYIGNIFDGVDIEKHSKLLEEYTKIGRQVNSKNKNKCNTCDLRRVCVEDICPSSTWDNYNSFFTKADIICFYQQTMFYDALQLMKFCKENDIKRFKEYFESCCGIEEGE